MPEKTRVAILGGGVGAMTAAFMLSEAPVRDRFDVTVYQKGWRLGGKGASGRNADRAQRIEEHGPHFFLGFYGNAFWMLQKCYRELARPAGSPLARWDDAFKPLGLITLLEPKGGGWVSWPLHFPMIPGAVPGFPDADEIPPAGGEPSTVWELIVRLLDWLGHQYERLPAALQLVNLGGLLQHTRVIAETFVRLVGPPPAEVAALLLDQLDQFRRHLDVAVLPLLRLDDGVRRIWILLRLGEAIVRGLIADDVPHRGFDALDDCWELRKWLQWHGAPAEAVWSAPVQAIYDLVFAYENGFTDRPNLAAGSGLRGALRMFLDYQGAIFWKMQAGMGDVIFAPLYRVLVNRGVRFRFFHRVDHLGLSDDKTLIDTIHLSRQATMRAGDYRPTVTVNDLECWPAGPDADQFIDVERAAYLAYKAQQIEVFESAWSPWEHAAPLPPLRRGQDFDQVVLGISLAAVPAVCRELIDARPLWRQMVERVQTVQTQSFQLWLSADARALGWAADQQNLIAGYVEPFNSVVDMSQVIPREAFPPDHPVQSVAYVFGPMSDANPIPPPGPDATFPVAQLARVKAAALDFLRTRVAPVWPGATDPANPTGLDWNTLVDLNDQAGAARLDSQFFRANIDPTERYVLSVKGSTAARLPADASGFDNLCLAGDWTATGLNAGCAEAAVMSGMRAARKIAGYPWRIVGEEG